MQKLSDRISLCLVIVMLCIFTMPSRSSAQNWVCTGKTGCTTLGSVCPDSTVFAGCVEGTIPVYASRCDIGFTWNGTTCANSAVAYALNNNNTNYTTTGATSLTNGLTNTATLLTTDSDSGAGGIQAHAAAVACNSLLSHGYSDWYLPSIYELWLLSLNGTAIGNFAALSYWSSTEMSNQDANFINFANTVRVIGFNPKGTNMRVRCVRRA